MEVIHSLFKQIFGDKVTEYYKYSSFIVVLYLVFKQVYAMYSHCSSTCYVVQADLELSNFIPQPPHYWDYQSIKLTIMHGRGTTLKTI
jgi:hypothetical protein